MLGEVPRLAHILGAARDAAAAPARPFVTVCTGAVLYAGVVIGEESIIGDGTEAAGMCAGQRKPFL